MIEYLKDVYRALRHEKNLRGELHQRTMPTEVSLQAKAVMTELAANGVAKVDDFIDPATCDTICQEIQRLIREYRDQIWVDNEASDHRIFGADLASEAIRDIMNRPLVGEISQLFEGVTTLNSFMMAAFMQYKANNEGSGGGWHRDRPDRPELKIILYLSDVSAENGPFQYFQKSHLPKSLISTVIGRQFDFMQSRFTDQEISTMDQSNLLTVTAKKGTLLIADTRGIHRGMPIQKGERYALTKYTWPHEIPETHLAEMIKPKA